MEAVMKIDPNKTWRRLDERILTEQNPAVRRNLEMVRKHAVVEAKVDLEALMATVSDRAAYRCFSSAEPRMNPVGKSGVQQFYHDFAASGATRLEFDVERIIADRHAVLTVGIMRMAYPGRTLMAMGIEVDDPAAFYLYESRTAVIWMFDEHGLITCEDSYTGLDGFAGIAGRRLRVEDPASRGCLKVSRLIIRQNGHVRLKRRAAAQPTIRARLLGAARAGDANWKLGARRRALARSTLPASPNHRNPQSNAARMAKSR
jgi:hypothetical protein